MSDDQQIGHRISELVDLEHHLEQAHIGKGLSDDERARLDRVQVELDQCWDLLRQRRARRAAGQDPDDVEVRPADVVENYRQ